MAPDESKIPSKWTKRVFQKTPVTLDGLPPDKSLGLGLIDESSTERTAGYEDSRPIRESDVIDSRYIPKGTKPGRKPRSRKTQRKQGRKKGRGRRQ